MAIDLSREDSLRLNVLLAQDLKAVRIDESRMAVHALSDKGEAKITLNPTCRDEPYLRQVRQVLSTHVLGSPGGYPVYLKRWTRMGQARDTLLERLLLLGEPEAVTAVVHAPGLTDELARRAWWAQPSADNARRMLERDCVACATMGPELAAFLIEFLPFEESHQAMMDTVRLVLKPGLIDAQTRLELWNRGRRRNSYYVGFLQATPDDLLETGSAHPDYNAIAARLTPLAKAGNAYARQLLRVLSAPGQAFLKTAETVLRRPTDQDVVVAVLDAISGYFASVRPAGARRRLIVDILADVTAFCAADPAEVRVLLDTAPELSESLQAMLVLSLVGEPVVAPIFGLTDAVGTVMRRKLESVTAPILTQCAVLCGASGR